MSAKNLANLSSAEFKCFLDSFDNVFCDCDGVLWTEPNTAFPGVKETISKLKEHGKKVRFVSNNGFRGIDAFYKRFQGHNYDVNREDITYPTLAIINYLKKIKFDKEIFLLGSTVMKKEMRDAGFKLAELKTDKIEENVIAIINSFEDNPKVGAVVFDFDLNLNYLKLLKATVYLRRPDVLFIKSGDDRHVSVDGKLRLVGHGYFHDIAEDMTGRKGMSFGKPDINFNEYLKERFEINDPSRTLFVGDAIEQDMEFAGRCGYQKLLVLSGASKLEQVEKCSRNEVPDFYINNFGQLYELIKSKL